jgi:hypothetical protein
MTHIAWVRPAALWTGTPEEVRAPEFGRPELVELAGDDFVPDFLALMAGRSPLGSPAALAGMVRRRETGATRPLKLFQPLHGRYYLVAASLVCRQRGLPDRDVRPAEGQRVTYVLRRRLPDGTEQGWVDEGLNRGWRPLREPGRDGVERPVALRSDEERLPLHPVPMCQLAAPGADPGLDAFGLSACDRRSVYYGYIPVSAREKYIERPLAGVATADAVERYREGLKAFSGEADLRLMEFDTRAIAPWRELFSTDVKGPARPGQPAPTPPLPVSQIYAPSLGILLDLGELIQRHLPDVYATLTSGEPDGANEKTLVTKLRAIQISIVTAVPGDKMTLAAALAELKPFLPMAYGLPPTGTPTPTQPPHTYNLRDAPAIVLGQEVIASGAALDTLRGVIAAALGDQGETVNLHPDDAALIAAQVTRLPSAEVKSNPTGTAAIERQRRTYFIRLIYEYPPCPPVVSAVASEPFIFAAPFDADAPARAIRLELPDISNLRKFKRGVGMEMTPELRDMMTRVHKGMLEGAGLNPSTGGWELGMICSFSIQIVFLVAFIVMFIFLILLNIVFWWLPFLKICFPIPVPKQTE